MFLQLQPHRNPEKTYQNKTHFILDSGVDQMIAAKIGPKFNDGYGSRWNCQDCDYTSSHLGTLKRHVEAKHILSSYICNPCNQYFTSQRSLQSHNNKYHKL